tara:strand:- start:272 stop:508 length:237 start_codon:yes stop_codon:yes gene_type:complete
MDILQNIPIELKRLVMSFVQRPPHYLAMKTGLIPVFDREIIAKIDGEITLYNEEMDIEWEEFINYTPSQYAPSQFYSD